MMMIDIAIDIDYRFVLQTGIHLRH